MHGWFIDDRGRQICHGVGSNDSIIGDAANIHINDPEVSCFLLLTQQLPRPLNQHQKLLELNRSLSPSPSTLLFVLPVLVQTLPETATNQPAVRILFVTPLIAALTSPFAHAIPIPSNVYSSGGSAPAGYNSTVENFCTVPETLACCNGLAIADVAGEPDSTQTGCKAFLHSRA